MESKDSVDNGMSGIVTIVPVSQTLDAEIDLCGNVCPKTTITKTTPVDDGGIKCDHPNVPNVPVEPVVTMLPSGNGCSTEQLDTVDGAVKGSIKSDDKSDGDALKAMVRLVPCENDCSDKPFGTIIDGDEFTVISQTLDYLCEKVCSNTTFHITSVDVDGGIKCHDTNVPKSTHGAVEPMVTPSPSGNGCSAEQLSTASDGAAKGGIECDGSLDTGALKPIVTLTPSENGCSVPLVTSTINDGAVTSGMECDSAITNTDTAMNDNKSKTCSVGEIGDYNHEINNQAIDEPCNANKTTQEDQPTSLHSKCYEDDIDSTRTGDDNDINKTSSPNDNLEESGKQSSISDECAAPVARDNIVSESSELKCSAEHENSTQSIDLGIPNTTANACDKVSHTLQNTDGLDHKNQNGPDAQMSKRRRRKKVISKKNGSNHQTPSSSKSAGLTPRRNVAVNDFEFVLSVVQQDLEEIQMSNETAKSTVSPEEEMNEDNSDDDSDSSDSSSSTSDSSSSTESNSKSFAENRIEEDEERVRATSGPPKTKDEMLLSELPPPVDVEVMANKDQIKALGKIESIINAEAMVIIKSFPDVPALDSDSILFLDDGSGFGQVFDIFGQVTSPHYCVRFNNEDEIRGKNLSIGQTVFYAPNTESMTNFVFVSNLRRVKGSDASCKHDQEPPNELLEYSDDEAESAAKAAKKKANRLKNQNQTQTQEKDTMENVKKQRKPNPSTSQPPCKKQAIHQQYQPRQPYQPPPPPRPFNIRQRGHPTEFYSERFQLGQNVPMQFNLRSHPPRPCPQPMQRLPSGNFYHHQPPQQYYSYTQVPAGPAPPQIRSHQPHIPLDLHRMHGPPNGPLQHVPLELRQPPPPQNAGQPADQLWSPRVNSHPGSRQPVDLGQFVARPRWPTVHPPVPQAPDGRPPFYCPPR